LLIVSDQKVTIQQTRFKICILAHIDSAWMALIIIVEHVHLLRPSRKRVHGHSFIFRTFFVTLDANHDKLVSFEELEKSDIEAWKDFCRATEDPHGPTRFVLSHLAVFCTFA